MNKTFPVWKTIRLGEQPSLQAYFRIFKEKGIEVRYDAKEILNRTRVSQNQVEIDLVLIKVADLGYSYKRFTRYLRVYNKAKKLGLELCPVETALVLCLQGQPHREDVTIAIKPSGPHRSMWRRRTLRISNLREISKQEKGIWLCCSYDNFYEPVVSPDDLLVFVKPCVNSLCK